MSPDSARASHRRMIESSGEGVTIRRYTGTGLNRPRFDARVKARVMGLRPDELTGSIIQGDQRLVVMADDLIAAQWPVPLVKGDKAVVRGKELDIEYVDDSTRRIQGVLIAYELRVRG